MARSAVLLIGLLAAGCLEVPSEADRPCTGGLARAVHPDTGACFALFAAPLAWDAAREVCAELGGDLARELGPTETELVREILGDTEDVWIGGSDDDTEGAWQWVDGAPISYQRWGDGQPDNNGDAQNCLLTAGTERGWDDDYCSSERSYLCEL